MKIYALPLLIAVCCSTSAAKSTQVMVGGEEDLDACSSLSQVGGAKSGFISLRAGPGTAYAETDRLANGQFVFACDTSAEWSGVVYLPGQQAPDCGVSSPIAKRGPYKGKCRSGWVRSKWLTVVAG
jgi:hypothetical protein